MGLESCKVEAIIAVSDMARGTDFYEGRLGLAGGPEGDDGGVTYRCAGETLIHIYPSEHAGKSAATLAAWSTDDLEGIVAELSSKGIHFERYDTARSRPTRAESRTSAPTGSLGSRTPMATPWGSAPRKGMARLRR